MNMTIPEQAQKYINKFTAIPDDKWITGRLIDTTTGARCATGHCLNFDENGNYDIAHTAEYNGLNILFLKSGLRIPAVNDKQDLRYQQATPKARIIAALTYIKNGTVPPPKY